MLENATKVTLELKKTGLRLLNENELELVGSGNGQKAVTGDVTDTTDVTSISTAA